MVYIILIEGTIEKKKLLLHWKLKVTFILKHFFSY